METLAVNIQTGIDGLDVRLEGELDVDTAAGLWADMDEWDVGPSTTLDLSGLTFVDSTGLGCLMKLQRRVADADGVLVARGVRPSVRRALETTGLNRLIAVLD